MDRIAIGPHRWCILHLESDDSFLKVLLQSDAFSEAEELLICVGLLLCVLVYTGRNADRKLTCRILTCDTVAGGLSIKGDRFYISSFQMDPLRLIHLYHEGRFGPLRNLEPYRQYRIVQFHRS